MIAAVTIAAGKCVVTADMGADRIVGMTVTSIDGDGTGEITATTAGTTATSAKSEKCEAVFRKI
jgi:hypothetical protein